MVECPKCHAENRDDSKFCGDCAATALVMAIGNEGLPSLTRFRRRPYD